MGQLNYQRHGPAEARELTADLLTLYALVFGEPPYDEGPADVARFAANLHRELAEPGFTLVTARRADDLAGMAYGYTMAPGEWWPDATTEPPATVVSGAKLVIMEWAVDPAHRGGGIGRELLTRLLTGRPEPFAVLKANPAAPAYDIYLRTGWHPCGTARRDGHPEVHLLALDLR